MHSFWAALHAWVGAAAARFDLRDVLVSIAIGWFAVQGLQALAGPLPAAATSAVGLIVSLVALFTIIPRLTRR